MIVNELWYKVTPPWLSEFIMDELEILLCKDRFSNQKGNQLLNLLIGVEHEKDLYFWTCKFVLQGAVCGIHVFGLTKSKVKIFLDVCDIWLLPICKYEVRKMGFHLCTSTTSTIGACTAVATGATHTSECVWGEGLFITLPSSDTNSRYFFVS